MTIEKKSLISSMNTTKKAIVASAPSAGSSVPVVVKAAAIRRSPAKMKLAIRKYGVKTRLGKKNG